MNDNSSTRATTTTTFDWHDNADGGSSCQVGNRKLIITRNGIFYNSEIWLTNGDGSLNRILASYRYAPRTIGEARAFLEREYDGYAVCIGHISRNSILAAFDIIMEGARYWCWELNDLHTFNISCNDLYLDEKENLQIPFLILLDESIVMLCKKAIRERRNRLSDYLLNVVI